MDKPILISSDDEESDFESAFSKIKEDLTSRVDHGENKNFPSESDEIRNLISFTSKRYAHDLSDSDSNENVPSISGILSEKEQQPQKGKRKHKKVSDEERLRKKEQDEKKRALNEKKKRMKEEEAKKKAEKKATAELLKKMKPGECMKYVTVVVDSNLLSCPFGGALLAAIQSSGANSKISSQLTPYSITWTQKGTDGVENDQNRVVILWNLEIAVQTIARGTLHKDVMQVQKLHPNKIIFLVIFGMEGYFRQQKSNKTKSMKSQITGSKNSESNSNSLSSDTLPVITRIQLEESLTEVQLLCDCCHRLLETAEDVGLFMSQITKAIAETPYKKMVFDKTQKNLEWYATGDSKDCVRVDKNGNGLSRLWQKQICQFNFVGLDVADAVINCYKTPQALISAYDGCESRKEAELLLQDLPVRRGVGPLVTSRRVGPEFSKKLYLFFNSDDPNITFSQES